MTTRVYVSMFGPMPDAPTGLATSVLRRAQAFAKAGVATTILVDRFVPDIDRHIAGLHKSDQLMNGLIEVRSMHLDLAERRPFPATNQYTNPRNDGQNGWRYVQDSKSEDIWRGYLNKQYQHFVWMRSESKVHFIDHLINDGKIRVNRTWHDESGRAAKIEYMDASNKPYKIQYLTPEQEVYLEEFPPNSSYRLISPTTQKRVEFNNYDELYEHWLSEYVLKQAKHPTIISEYGEKRKALEAIASSADAKIIYTFHSTHLAHPYTYGSKTRPDQKHFIDQIRSLSALVVLTNEQKLDLEKTYGALDNVFVIPHHAPCTHTTIDRNLKKIVIVGRFDSAKGHIDALKAFKRIHSRDPQTRLEVYGRGIFEQSIQSEIDTLDLNDVAKISGFTTDAATVFASAGVTLVPSKYEGFCLSMIEAMGQGCVPVAYNFKYGPADIIRNGTDGFVVEAGNILDLADSASLLMSSTELHIKMSNEAKKISERFSENALIRRWNTLFDTLDTGIHMEIV